MEATVPSPQEPEPPVIEVALPPTANPEVPLTEDPEPPVIEEVLPPTANPELPLTEEPELPSAGNTVQQLSTSDLQQPSTSNRTFEELLLDLCKNNNTTPGKPIKRRKIVHTCEIIMTEKYLQMKLNEEEKKQKALLEKEEKRKKKRKLQNKRKKIHLEQSPKELLMNLLQMIIVTHFHCKTVTRTTMKASPNMRMKMKLV